MAPLALLVYCCLVYFLFKKDKEIRQLSSNALWIPALLLAIIGTKPVSLWLTQLEWGYYKDDRGYIDQIFFTVIVAAAVGVLAARKVQWWQFATSNKALVLMYLFWVASCFWAPSGSASFKRLFKDFGCVIVGMIFLTERDPWQAIRTVFVRLAYVILPFRLYLQSTFQHWAEPPPAEETRCMQVSPHIRTRWASSRWCLGSS